MEFTLSELRALTVATRTRLDFCDEKMNNTLHEKYWADEYERAEKLNIKLHEEILRRRRTDV